MKIRPAATPASLSALSWISRDCWFMDTSVTEESHGRICLLSRLVEGLSINYGKNDLMTGYAAAFQVSTNL